VVQLADSLVDSAADAPDRHDVLGQVVVPDVGDGLAEIGRVLVGVVNDLGVSGRRRVVLADFLAEGIQVANDDVERVLGVSATMTVGSVYTYSSPTKPPSAVEDTLVDKS
jgi:hypothetical protein